MLYLDQIAKRREKGDESDTELLFEIKAAFDEWAAKASSKWSEAKRRWYDLLCFCTDTDSIAPMLRDQPQIIRTALAFAQQHKEEELATLLANALAGKQVEGGVSVTVGLPDGTQKTVAVPEPESTRFAGKDWGATDILVSMALDGFEKALLDDILAHCSMVDLQPPLLRRQKMQAKAAIAAKLEQNDKAKSLFLELVGGKKCRMLAGSWDDFEMRNIESAKEFVVKHKVGRPASKAALARLATQYGEAAAPLLDIHADHDGAVLFIVKGEPGFCMASVGEWDQLKTEVMEWAQQVTWQEDPEEIPKYLHTAIAFGVIPGDSEKWLLITEGEHAGKIMLSDGDVIEDTPRYDSLAEFFAALLCDPAQVLNCGGYIDYGDDLVPIAYRHD